MTPVKLIFFAFLKLSDSRIRGQGCSCPYFLPVSSLLFSSFLFSSFFLTSAFFFFNKRYFQEKRRERGERKEEEKGKRKKKGLEKKISSSFLSSVISERDSMISFSDCMRWICFLTAVFVLSNVDFSKVFIPRSF